MELASLLWGCGIAAELVPCSAPTLTEQYEWAHARGLRWLVLLDERVMGDPRAPQVGGSGLGECAGCGACWALLATPLVQWGEQGIGQQMRPKSEAVPTMRGAGERCCSVLWKGLGDTLCKCIHNKQRRRLCSGLHHASPLPDLFRCASSASIAKRKVRRKTTPHAVPGNILIAHIP